MYRNYYMNKRSCCSCNNMCNNNNKQDIIDNSCEYVQNINNLEKPCECGFDEDNSFPENPMLAQSYVPWQTMGKTFMPSVGLKMGTIFPELVSPYMAGQSLEEIKLIRRKNRRGV